MKKKASQKNNKFGNKVAAKATPKKPAPPFGKKPKAKIPALGRGLMGMGGTGAQGMIP